MIITYPHMGSLSWLLGALFREQGIPFISPPPCSKQTLEVGVRYAPQGACLPMKIVLGNFLEAQKQGADTALFFGDVGHAGLAILPPCFKGSVRSGAFRCANYCAGSTGP
ncbi:MAG: hypothetical protein ACLR23_06855 [Clostridia bacterium]